MTDDETNSIIEARQKLLEFAKKVFSNRVRVSYYQPAKPTSKKEYYVLHVSYDQFQELPRDFPQEFQGFRVTTTPTLMVELHKPIDK